MNKQKNRLDDLSNFTGVIYWCVTVIFTVVLVVIA